MAAVVADTSILIALQPVAGTAGILLRAKQAGLIPAIRPLLDRLLSLGFRLAPAIREAVLADAGDLDWHRMEMQTLPEAVRGVVPRFASTYLPGVRPVLRARP